MCTVYRNEYMLFTVIYVRNNFHVHTCTNNIFIAHLLDIGLIIVRFVFGQSRNIALTTALEREREWIAGAKVGKGDSESNSRRWGKRKRKGNV